MGYTGNDGKIYPTVMKYVPNYEIYAEILALPLAETKFRDGSLIPFAGINNINFSNSEWEGLGDFFEVGIDLSGGSATTGENRAQIFTLNEGDKLKCVQFAFSNFDAHYDLRIDVYSLSGGLPDEKLFESTTIFYRNEISDPYSYSKHFMFPDNTLEAGQYCFIIVPINIDDLDNNYEFTFSEVGTYTNGIALTNNGGGWAPLEGGLQGSRALIHRINAVPGLCAYNDDWNNV